jgi:hypothetical protein
MDAARSPYAVSVSSKTFAPQTFLKRSAYAPAFTASITDCMLASLISSGLRMGPLAWSATFLARPSQNCPPM